MANTSDETTEKVASAPAAGQVPASAGEQEHLKKGLQNRHIQLIALGGAIGTGLFYGSAESIQLARTIYSAHLSAWWRTHLPYCARFGRDEYL